ncbi:MAG TPA: FecR domain-containing protein [Pyrinomonadaceae bacterium]|nr:FecR domain-containing protein [Pyrinomonadaceae bacterium]
MATADKIVPKGRRFEVDWFFVSKRLIYLGVFSLLLLAAAGGVSLYAWLYGNPLKGADALSNAPAGARFLSFDGDVQVVRAETRERLLARGDTQLYPGDLVQTQTDGRARIQLADGSTLVVRPNSVVTIRDNERLDDGARTQVRVAVERGQINVRTEEQTEGSRNVVETPLTKNNVSARTGASFGVRDDNTEEVRVDAGRIETTTRGGERTVINGGEYVALNQSGAVKNRERLLDVPAPLSPRDLERVAADARGTADVLLRWQRPASGAARHYRVEVATSPFFVQAGKVTERDQLETTSFNVSELRTGVFFWRVRAVAPSGQTSDWCEPQKFTVAAGGAGGDGGGAHLAVANVTFEYVAGQIYVARGQTQPGNAVRIAGRETAAARDGTFELQISAPHGARSIEVETEDPHGNRRRARVPFAPRAAPSG